MMEILFYLFFIYLFKVYLFILKESVHTNAQVGEGQRERERERKSTSTELNVGLELMNHEITT